MVGVSKDLQAITARSAALPRRLVGFRDSSKAVECVLLLAQGEQSEAELYFREALESRRRVLGDDHPETLTSLNNMGGLLKAQGKLSEAEALLLPAVAIADTKVPERHPLNGKLSKTLAKLYQAWDQAEPGKGFDLKAAEWQARFKQWQVSTQPASAPSSAPSAASQPSAPMSASQPARAD